MDGDSGATNSSTYGSVEGLNPMELELLRSASDVGGSQTVSLHGDQNGIRLRPSRSTTNQSVPKDLSNKVRFANAARRDEEVEAFIELLELLLVRRAASGLVLNKKEVSLPPGHQLPETAKVLGKGGNGAIYIVTDPKTGKESACKMVMIASFHGDVIRTWLHLADKGLAPELYSFRIVENKVEFKMEIIKGKTLTEIMDDLWSQQPASDLTRPFSLIVLKDLLTLFEEQMHGEQFTHGDMYESNVMYTKSMSMKVIDFESARRFMALSGEKKARRVQFDIVGIIRLFSTLFSGYGFEDSQQALQILQADDLSLLNPLMQGIPEEHRKEMYMIIMEVFGCVKDPMRAGFGNLAPVRELIQDKLADEGVDVDVVKRRVAAIVFPEHFQPMLEEKDGEGFSYECEVDAADDHCDIWDHPNMDFFQKMVTDEALAGLGIFI
ncbi:uncharacterized protein LOC101861177 [Aplysia californica]|uniref:Uncharacterized protein LOC101861177 n=1 Tax=Aplysia californica TaxID=6500 RepID=A0ABM1W473_APLCA|nr:uncharacterized protein LOC101861177 [Aplysia californica]XP_035829465.1 uncharacterized protein LOC101861177 [Aplysia californica]XP_035829466.1 uncharacterized protein LOC101861177 [Aplysia californica]